MTVGGLQSQLECALRVAVGASSDFDLNPEVARPDAVKLRKAAVLIAIEDTKDGPVVHLTKRASVLRHHPGQIAFPGGKVDAADNGSATVAALREAREEIGLPESNATVIGTLPHHVTVTNFEVTPVVAMINAAFESQVDKGEVEEAFTVPLAHVTDARNFLIQSRVWQGRPRYYYVVPYGPYYIWGATARMLRGLAEQVAQCGD